MLGSLPPFTDEEIINRLKYEIILQDKQLLKKENTIKDLRSIIEEYKNANKKLREALWNNN